MADGPSYPFIFQPNISRTMANKEIQFPTAPHAHFGYKIIKTLYQPYENENQSPGPLRYPVELKDLEKMLELWEKGLSVLEEALPLMPPKKRDNGDRLYALAKFMRNAVRTVIHMKNWWMLNIRLQSLSSREEMLAVLDKIEAVAKRKFRMCLIRFHVSRPIPASAGNPAWNMSATNGTLNGSSGRWRAGCWTLSPTAK